MSTTQKPMAELSHFLEALTGRVRTLGAYWLSPWLVIVKKILKDESLQRRSALKALDELQITTNPTARTDELYANIRQCLSAGLMVVLLGLSGMGFEDDLRRSGRLKNPIRVISSLKTI